MINFSETIISQYANSPVLGQLIANMNQYIDPSADLDNFYDFVWNVDTAQGFGLDTWGKIVGVSRLLNIPGALQDFGFDEGNANADYFPFGQAPFYNGPTQTTVYRLSDDAYRTLIFVKALANITDCTIPSLNQLLRNFFGTRGRCYIGTTGNMSFRYTFEFGLLAYEIAVMTQSGAIPRPAGMNATVLQVDVPTTWGFAEAQLSQPFGQGVFFNNTTGLLHAA